MFILNENGYFLFESKDTIYQYKTTIAPPFDKYPKSDYDFRFNFRSEKWEIIPKSKIKIIDKTKNRREKKILKKSSYNTTGGIKFLKLKGE